MKRLINYREIREIRRDVRIVSLAKAALCVNCEHISEAVGECCPRCGSPSLLSLARILNRREVA
jgi:hypothetical protein